jgi:hypothetical protein
MQRNQAAARAGLCRDLLTLRRMPTSNLATYHPVDFTCSQEFSDSFYAASYIERFASILDACQPDVMQPYVYQPLRPAPNSIRLLRVLPGDEGTDIHCQIVDYTIRSGERTALYEALSYVWGTSTDTRRIYMPRDHPSDLTPIKTCYLDITANL